MHQQTPTAPPTRAKPWHHETAKSLVPILSRKCHRQAQTKTTSADLLFSRVLTSRCATQDFQANGTLKVNKCYRDVSPTVTDAVLQKVYNARGNLVR
jgi:hypothetical protein